MSVYCPNDQIVTTKAAELFEQSAAYKPLFDKLKAFLYAGTIDVCPGIPVIHQNFQICVPMLFCVSSYIFLLILY